MPRYIDAEEAIKTLSSVGNREYRRKDGTLQDAIKFLSSAVYIPTADVQEVTHGAWFATNTYDQHKQPIYVCTNCKREVADYFINCHKFCLHCGAKMDDDEKRMM